MSAMEIASWVIIGIAALAFTVAQILKIRLRYLHIKHPEKYTLEKDDKKEEE